MGLLTLVIFPVPAYFLLGYTDSFNFEVFIDLKNLEIVPVLIGLEWGLFYACFATFILNSGLLKEEKQYQIKMLRQLNLNLGDMLFLSLCAGIGEELLFRVGVQHYLGVVFSTLIFVALHGYFDPRNWRASLYGLLVSPFILFIGYGLNYFGLWFCIAAHFSYDLLLFIVYARKRVV